MGGIVSIDLDQMIYGPWGQVYVLHFNSIVIDRQSVVGMHGYGVYCMESLTDISKHLLQLHIGFVRYDSIICQSGSLF